MLRLMRLELVKFKLWPTIRGAFITICIVSIFIPLIIFDGELDSYESAFQWSTDRTLCIRSCNWLSFLS